MKYNSVAFEARYLIQKYLNNQTNYKQTNKKKKQTKQTNDKIKIKMENKISLNYENGKENGNIFFNIDSFKKRWKKEKKQRKN